MARVMKTCRICGKNKLTHVAKNDRGLCITCANKARKGEHRSDQWCQDMSRKMKEHWASGKRSRIMSEEQKVKLRTLFLGRHHTEATKQKLSVISKARGVSRKAIEGSILFWTGRPKSEETKKKISVTLKGRKNPCHSLIMKGRKLTDEQKRKISESEKGIPKPKPTTVEYKKKVSEIIKMKWQSPDYVSMQMEARGCKPNKVEKSFLKILAIAFPKEWEYVGDGQLIIGNKCPDFSHTEKKLLVEVFGLYWHRGQNPEERVNYFKGFGYNTLVFWENEVRDVEGITSKIKDAYSHCNSI